MIIFLLEDSTTIDPHVNKMESLRKLLVKDGHDARIMTGKDANGASMKPEQVASEVEGVVLTEGSTVGLVLDLNLCEDNEYGAKVLDNLRIRIGDAQIRRVVVYSRLVAKNTAYWSQRLQIPEKQIFPRLVTRVEDIAYQFAEFVQRDE